MQWKMLFGSFDLGHRDLYVLMWFVFGICKLFGFTRFRVRGDYPFSELNIWFLSVINWHMPREAQSRIAMEALNLIGAEFLCGIPIGIRNRPPPSSLRLLMRPPSIHRL